MKKVNEAGGNFKGILKRLYFNNRYSQQDINQGIEKQINKLDINLKGVFLTHMHEHASGAPSLQKEILYVYGEGERNIDYRRCLYLEKRI